MGKINILLLISLSIISCNRNIKEKTLGGEPKIVYYRDCRTNLCFAEISQHNNVTGHTYVPCDSVLKFLTKCKD